jgi:hypothetical protein
MDKVQTAQTLNDNINRNSAREQELLKEIAYLEGELETARIKLRYCQEALGNDRLRLKHLIR